MDTLILHFNDDKKIPVSTICNEYFDSFAGTSYFLYENSNLLKAVNNEDDIYIPILCSSSFVLDENDIFYFDNYCDLSFMFTLTTNKFLEVCKFLDIIVYENKDKEFSKQFITYVMNNIEEDINVIQYFMQSEIRSIMNYLTKINIDIQIRTCTPEFYNLFLNEYKEEVIKYNRYDIYNEVENKSDYYKYINKYDNQLTFNVKETQEYYDYIINIPKQLHIECGKQNNINKIIELVEQGADVNYKNIAGYTTLHIASDILNNIEAIQYLVEHGVNVNLQNIYGFTALHYASRLENNIEVIQYLVEQGADVNLQVNNGTTALHYACKISNNYKVIKCLIENDINMHLYDYLGLDALYYASNGYKKLNIIKLFIENGYDINLQNRIGNTLLFSVLYTKNNLEVIQYLIENGAKLVDDTNMLIHNNNGCTALDIASSQPNNTEVTEYLRHILSNKYNKYCKLPIIN